MSDGVYRPVGEIGVGPDNFSGGEGCLCLAGKFDGGQAVFFFRSRMKRRPGWVDPPMGGTRVSTYTADDGGVSWLGGFSC
ncbi:hypothetical protein E2C01_075977 [Portunus trituberculatus]|uniref:Uncharacterized protein n=1 Tax=Portunus trituberculatus TaxID=210409 RepID=A0A5B7IGN0_PORTR|nr:hypothetical protein [Portunus trituberculatus]